MTTTSKPTRMQQIKALNEQIDRLAGLRDASRTAGERKAYEYDRARCIRDRDALELGLYESYGVTVDR
jgi:hypothetical protein